MNKTIEINPSLFSLGLSKTKKNRDKSIKQNVPLISPNILKNKLLKRIKQHKLREIKDLETNNNSTNENGKQNTVKPQLVDVSAYTDEFNDSLDYLQNLSAQQKIKTDKLNNEKNKQKAKTDLERKTVKNYSSVYNSNYQNINVDLPNELKEESLIRVNTEQFDVNEPFIMHVTNNSHINNDVPYGVLKGGTKPTYRDWNKTQKNIGNVSTEINNVENQENKIISEREMRLHALKEKINQKKNKSPDTNYESNKAQVKDTDVWMSKNLIQKDSSEIPQYIAPIVSPILNPGSILNPGLSPVLNDIENNIPEVKRFIHKTIRRKYTLGKSKIKKTVAILLKDRKTRKNIISAHKDLKRKQIHDVKNYLRDHNLIKIGSYAPNDVIRQIYEHAMMSGEITNINKETLLHNFLKKENS